MKLFAGIILAVLIGCGNPSSSDSPKNSPKDVHESLKAQWQENVICVRQGDQCGCCNSVFGTCSFASNYASFTISSCEFAEKMGLRIY